MENTLHLWQSLLPRPNSDSHKYTRGHAVILGGSRLCGAARLASEAAMRAGAGLCSVVCDESVKSVYQCGAAHVLVECYSSLARFADHLADARRNAVLLGPGAGLEDKTGLQDAVLGTLAHKRATVLDADALSAFAGAPQKLFPALSGNCVLTPHEGEFKHLFPQLEGSKAERAAAAAKTSGAVILLKGAETVIAAPDGRLVLNTHASPYLATAGSGDVLAGIILGLLAQGMPAFEATCAAAWLQGETSLRLGAGLVAPDLIATLPAVVKDVLAHG